MKKSIFTIIMLCIAAIGMQAQETTWIVVGSVDLTGENWNISSSDNEMTPLGNGMWKWERENVSLTKEDNKYKFKVAKQGTWDGAQPSSDFQLYNRDNDGNNSYNYIYEAGTYTVTIFFNENTTDINVVLNGCTVAGESELVGSAWNTSDSNNDMTLGNNGIYRLEKSISAVTKDNTYGYKILTNHSWDGNYGKDNVRHSGNNAEVTPTYSGSLTLDGFDVTFTFKAAPATVGAETTP